MRERLRYLYGPELGNQTHAELERLLDTFRARLQNRAAPAERFSERDALLITYGDSILAPDRKSLSALNDFAVRYLQDLVSTIHILPFFPYSSDYGFSIIDFLTVNPELGDWNHVERLRHRFKLMIDFVLNHASAESEWYRAFLRGEPPYDQFFIALDPASDLSGVTRPRTTPLLTRCDGPTGPRHVWTTFSPDQVDLNYANPAVLLRMIEVMLSYVEYGADLLRMDAVGYLWKEVGTSCIHLPKTHAVVKLFRDVLDEVAPYVGIVTETNVPHEDNISYFGNGHDEAQMVYQFPLAPLVLDAFARADATILSRWVASLAPPTDQTTFFNFIASHDGLGLIPARGLLTEAQVAELARRTLAHGGQVSNKTNPDGSESPYELNITLFDALSDPSDVAEPFQTKLDRFICSQAIMLALQGVPGIYIHSLLGSHNDHAAYARSGWKRDLNHGRLDLPDLEARLAEPESDTAQVLGRFAQLLAARRAEAAFHPNAPQAVHQVGTGVFALRRGPRDGRTVLALHNVSNAPRVIQLPPFGGSHYTDLLSGRVVPAQQAFEMLPYETVWLR